MMNMSKSDRRSLNRWPGSDGFTLLEVLIAIAVLAVTLTVIFGSQSQSLSLATEARFYTRAAFLLEEKMAELESGLIEAHSSEGDFGERYPGYQWKLEASEIAIGDIVEGVSSDSREFLTRMTITITWQDSPYSLSMDYYHQPRAEK